MTLEERTEHLYQAQRDSHYRDSLLKYCEDGDDADVFFANLFLCTNDPRLDESGKPYGETEFLLWPTQENLIRFYAERIATGTDGAVKKSRDVGATVGALSVILRHFLLVRGFSALLSSITEDLIYKIDDWDALFTKLAFFIRSLPDWVKPKGYNEDRHLNYMKLINPENGNIISGQAPTARFGRSGRRTMALLDEWAFWLYGREAAKSCMGTTYCRIFISTPNGDEGESNHFYQLTHQAGEYINVRIKQFQIHWTEDPRKNKTAKDADGKTYFPWKLQQVGDIKKGIPGRMSEQEFAEEYDIDFVRSKKGRIYGEQMPYVEIGKFPYDPRFELATGWDWGVDDDTGIVFVQWDFERKRYRLVEYYRNSGHGAGFYTPFVTGRKDPDERLEHEASYSEADNVVIARRTSWQQNERVIDEKTGWPVWRKRVPYIGHYSDPNAKARGMSDGRSASDVLRDAEIHLIMSDKPQFKQTKGRHEASRRVLRYCDINEELCGPLIEGLNNYKWGKNREPEHDAASHPASAVQFFSVHDPWYDAWYDRTKSNVLGKTQIPGGVFGSIESLKHGGLHIMTGRNEEEMERNSRYTAGRRSRAGY